jgi:hypothetical protein
MKEEVKTNETAPKSAEEIKKEQIKKQKARAETQKFKSKYFEYYDDIKISDRQDW